MVSIYSNILFLIRFFNPDMLNCSFFFSLITQPQAAAFLVLGLSSADLYILQMSDVVVCSTPYTPYTSTVALSISMSYFYT
jgi:hypothetical protein